MNRIAEAFRQKKALIPRLTAGDPDLNVTAELIAAMEQSGADLIEIALPFSDPVAESPILQTAAYRALDAGVTTDKIFDMLTAARKNVSLPLVLAAYANSIFAYGTQRFLHRCKESGIDGLILRDVPFEEKAEFSAACKENGILLVSALAPTSKQRAAAIAGDAEGFLCCTAPGNAVIQKYETRRAVTEVITTAKAENPIPCVLDCGAAEPAQMKALSPLADGIVLSESVVSLIAVHGKNCVSPVKAYITQMKAALSAE